MNASMSCTPDLTHGTVAFSLVGGQDVDADFGVAVVGHGGGATGEVDGADDSIATYGRVP
jgi:hypothetical protein